MQPSCRTLTMPRVWRMRSPSFRKVAKVFNPGKIGATPATTLKALPACRARPAKTMDRAVYDDIETSLDNRLLDGLESKCEKHFPHMLSIMETDSLPDSRAMK